MQKEIKADWNGGCENRKENDNQSPSGAQHEAQSQTKILFCFLLSVKPWTQTLA